MELLTAVMHELGHYLGLEHTDSETDELMNESLAAGSRRLQGHSVADPPINQAMPPIDHEHVKATIAIASLPSTIEQLNAKLELPVVDASRISLWSQSLFSNMQGPISRELELAALLSKEDRSKPMDDLTNWLDILAIEVLDSSRKGYRFFDRRLKLWCTVNDIPLLP